MGVLDHRKKKRKKVRAAIITVSTTRTKETDESGRWIARAFEKEGHAVVCREIVTDDAALVSVAATNMVVDREPDVLVLTGGTGIGPKDVTIEAIRPLFKKELTAFGPLFAQLSFEEIDAAALISRAAAGVVGKTVVFCIPGSLKACKLAMKALILPEIGHLVMHLYE